MKKQKVFCIGFNKTGTMSLHEFFTGCGLKSRHNDLWPNYSKVANGKRYFKAQCYSDGEQSDFIQLQEWFPGSVFILNYRDRRKWIRSRIKHVMRFNDRVDIGTLLTDTRYGKMAREFFYDEEHAIRKWISEYQIYTKQAKSYFENKSNFLEIDITIDPDWEESISAFFGENNLKHNYKRRNTPIHSNERPVDNIENQELLEKYFAMADRLL